MSQPTVGRGSQGIYGPSSARAEACSQGGAARGRAGCTCVHLCVNAHVHADTEKEIHRSWQLKVQVYTKMLRTKRLWGWGCSHSTLDSYGRNGPGKSLGQPLLLQEMEKLVPELGLRLKKGLFPSCFCLVTFTSF